MIIYREADYAAMSRRCANLISAEVIRKPDCVLGLATGGTVAGIYRELVARQGAGDLSFRGVVTVNLDEYRGLAPEHEQSYRYFMQKNLFDHIDLRRENSHVPDGLAEDPEAECRRYDELIRGLGGVDLQLLGLGRNAHIGFNEPGPAFIKETHVTELTESTVEANSRFFKSREEVPRQALTMGIGSIMAARRVLLAVSGEDKADAVFRALCGRITPEVPASILQLHGDVVLVGDVAALSRLDEAGVELCG